MKLINNLLAGVCLTLVVCMPVSAENEKTQMIQEMKSTITVPLEKGIISEYVKAIGEPSAKGFMQEISLPEHTVYRSMHIDDSGKFGELLIREKGAIAVAAVIACRVEPDLPKEDIRNLLLEDTFRPNVREQLYQFNTMLLNVENLINEVAPNFIQKINQNMDFGDTPLPYNLVAINIEEVEQFHKMQEQPCIYASGVRSVIMADNFAIPLAVRFYLINHHGESRLLILFTTDSQYNTIKKIGDKIAKKATK